MQFAPHKLLANVSLQCCIQYVPRRGSFGAWRPITGLICTARLWSSQGSRSTVSQNGNISVGDGLNTHDARTEALGEAENGLSSWSRQETANIYEVSKIENARRGRRKGSDLKSTALLAPTSACNKWRERLVTFKQHEYESTIEEQFRGGSLLIDDELYAGDWQLWLELIRFRKRHQGAGGTKPLFKEIFRRNLCIPDATKVGYELWDILIMAGHHDPEFLEVVISYATKIKKATGHLWRPIYKSILVNALKKDPIVAHQLHVRLKQDFPPSTWIYTRLFNFSLEWDCVDAFEGLYRDFPVPSMYSAIVPELCKMQQFQRALRWHHLLFTNRDYPTEFYDVKSLLVYLAKVGDYLQVEQIVKDLKGAKDLIPSIPSGIETYIRKDKVLSREIFNRHLGEIHGVASKHLSDNFCARLFATKLFSVDTVIAGLQMMAVSRIGPLALREIAIRDDCHGETIVRHLMRLEDAGILSDQSAFSLLIRKLASAGNLAMLRPLVQSDLHPDNFDDINIQEKLLAEYHQRCDQDWIELTLAAITIRCKEADLAKWRWNLILRSHITLRNKDAVFSILEAMKRDNVPITTRSSRHLRVSWLSGRNIGRAAHCTKELTIIINASVSTLQSGRPVPITAWREILRRLGMAGRLKEVENLALWLVDHYTSAKAQHSLPDHIILGPSQGNEFSTDRNRHAFLNRLFTISAQHAIVAWGFKQEMQHLPVVWRLHSKRSPRPPYEAHWTWGLVLLRKLQERGVPIHQDTVARICKVRLKILFGNGISRSRINRKSRSLNDLRRTALDRYALEVYVKGMQAIWGANVFRGQPLQLEGMRSGQWDAVR